MGFSTGSLGVIIYYRQMSKFEIAEEQLFHAVQLYLDGTYIVSAITLAGAAEEILGELLKKQGLGTALDEKVETLCEMFEAVFDGPADRKAFWRLRTRARNELKHNRNGAPIDLDLEQEAVNILDRALENYRRLKPGPLDQFRAFQSERVKRWRRRCGEHA